LPGLCGFLGASDRAPPADGFSDIKGFPSNSLKLASARSQGRENRGERARLLLRPSVAGAKKAAASASRLRRTGRLRAPRKQQRGPGGRRASAPALNRQRRESRDERAEPRPRRSLAGIDKAAASLPGPPLLSGRSDLAPPVALRAGLPRPEIDRRCRVIRGEKAVASAPGLRGVARSPASRKQQKARRAFAPALGRKSSREC